MFFFSLTKDRLTCIAPGHMFFVCCACPITFIILLNIQITVNPEFTNLQCEYGLHGLRLTGLNHPVFTISSVKSPFVLLD